MPDDKRIRYLSKDDDGSLPAFERIPVDQLQALPPALASRAQRERARRRRPRAPADDNPKASGPRVLEGTIDTARGA